MMHVRDFVVDIETCHASEKFICAAQFKILRDVIPKNFKDPVKIASAQEKIEAKYEAGKKRIRDKSACLNAAPIGCIGMAADDRLLNFSILKFSDADLEVLSGQGIEPFTFQDEKSMMQSFVDFVNDGSSEYSRIAGFNSFKFDFPKIRLACRRNDVRLPEILKPVCHQNQIDLMRDFIREYNCEDAHRLMISLHTVCDEFGIEYKKTLTGAEIPGAIHEGKPGQHLTVALDCTSDVIETYKALLKIRG